MTAEKLYVMFRQEIDAYASKSIIDNLDVRKIEYNGKTIGILILEGTYIDAFYILPEYRRKGIGKKFIIEQYHKDNDKWETLHIVKTNKPAVEFWNNIFDLQIVEENFCDSCYLIEGVKIKL